MIRSTISLAALIALVACSTSENSAPAQTVNTWYDAAQQTLAKRKAIKPLGSRAKNVILFVADGMDVTTITAARIFDGQSRGGDGEENVLPFERFPYLAMSKTYTTDYQVPDSAGTMSAMVTGVKTKSGLISVTDDAKRGNCESALAAPASTLGELAKDAGMKLGIVSTARLTHATPAAVYAHSADRNWEADSAMMNAAKAAGCRDIASQLIDFSHGDGIDIALGGGRRNFLPADMADPEDDGEKGVRKDGRDLTAEWTAKSDDHLFVWNTDQLMAASTDAKILGLFERSHMEYEADRADDVGGEPSLEAMTKMAIERLAGGDEGYFLMVEAGRVDHAHHGSNAYRALADAQEYAQAVAAAVEMTNERDTLIIVTADHGHTMSFQGYPRKGANILGAVEILNVEGKAVPLPAQDGKPYTTLAYTNGPGSVFRKGVDLSKGRPAPDADSATNKNYQQQSVIPLGSETHGGQDVTIYAHGPNAHLFGGVVEQNYIFHVIEDALDLKARADR